MKKITEKEFNKLNQANPFEVTESALLENLEGMNNGLDFISNVNGITYYWSYRNSEGTVRTPFEGGYILASFFIFIGRDYGERNAANKKILTYEDEEYGLKLDTELTNESELVKKAQKMYTDFFEGV